MCTAERVDIEITLHQGEIIESRIATLEEGQRIPREVSALGPEALAAYQDFLDRVASGAPHIVEHVEVFTAA